MLSKQSENCSVTDYSRKEIIEELNHILSSPLFSRSVVLTNFLKFIVEETLNGKTEGLKEYTIAVNALGKPSDFNPQIDAIVRIHAGRLRRLLKEYYDDLGKFDTIKIEVVKGTYVPIFRTNFIPEKKSDVSIGKMPNQFSRAKLTLAVLPFRNLCPNGEYQFFADGFGEELTRTFSNFQDIAVVAHHSTRIYASNHADVRIIGSDLGVHYLITGSVKRSSTAIRINVALIETMKGMQVWSETYNHELNIDNLIDIQDQIISNVCSILGGYYGFIIHENWKTHRKTILSVDSFDAALWNYYLHMNFSLETYMQTRLALEEALKINPNYATGLAMLSELYLDAYSLGFPTVTEPVKEAYELAKKAVKMDPQCQHAYQQLGWANIYMKRKEEAIKALEYCLSLNPSSVSTIGTVGFGMACVGEYDRALELLLQSLDLNPHCPWWFYLGFFFVYYHNGDYVKALDYANKIETMDVFYEPLSKAIAKAQLGLLPEIGEDVNILTDKYSDILANLKAALSTTLYDTDLVEKIIEGCKKAGLIVGEKN
ncbi:hypothetical protein ACFPH8_11100 [Bizionia hallyeonensis]|uniref:TolB amino-terminal domain-containing protein n=1 Tax=Bizionia hallyeonensis TaxID=1123757 RepID=A0ABW0C6P3_9FLAO